MKELLPYYAILGAVDLLYCLVHITLVVTCVVVGIMRIRHGIQNRIMLVGIASMSATVCATTATCTLANILFNPAIPARFDVFDERDDMHVTMNMCAPQTQHNNGTATTANVSTCIWLRNGTVRMPVNMDGVCEQSVLHVTSSSTTHGIGITWLPTFDTPSQPLDVDTSPALSMRLETEDSHGYRHCFTSTIETVALCATWITKIFSGMDEPARSSDGRETIISRAHYQRSLAIVIAERHCRICPEFVLVYADETLRAVYSSWFSSGHVTRAVVVIEDPSETSSACTPGVLAASIFHHAKMSIRWSSIIAALLRSFLMLAPSILLATVAVLPSASPVNRGLQRINRMRYRC